jgi:hypothetical protein
VKLATDGVQADARVIEILFAKGRRDSERLRADFMDKVYWEPVAGNKNEKME